MFANGSLPEGAEWMDGQDRDPLATFMDSKFGTHTVAVSGMQEPIGFDFEQKTPPKLANHSHLLQILIFQTHSKNSLFWGPLLFGRFSLSLCLRASLVHRLSTPTEDNILTTQPAEWMDGQGPASFAFE